MNHFKNIGIGCLLIIGMLISCRESTLNTTTEEMVTSKVVPETIDFNFHVKPILSDKCFQCHGPDVNTRKAGLAFHDEKLAFAAIGKNKDYYAIVKGDIEKSKVIDVIFAENIEERMPPQASNLVLSKYEKNILKKWIEQGAEWKQHWALISPIKSEVPEIAENNWGKNEIDHFVLEKLKEQNLEPSASASKEKILRRLSFDLAGLPPSIEQLDQFLADESSNAIETVIDQLLSGKSYAERMAINWMDVARYADTHGYQNDYERHMWPWRNWVIYAFDKNMPYDQFVKWQLAGDLLPNATKEQILATGFNRNHKITAEGGVIPEEYRTEYVADRSETFSTAFLGLTMQCARCHDHKYDPLSQKDYFSLFSFFNNIPEEGLASKLDSSSRYAPKPSMKLTQEEIKSIAGFIYNDTVPEIEVMVMAETAPRQSYILNRGQYNQPTEKVESAAPNSILPFKGFQKNRMGLADWLFDERNPLTARVAVNRLWQQLFGNGLVSSSFDFGNQGALPTHPELLDYLAVKYIELGWDTKAMLKYMAMSATYQQSTKVSEKQLVLDPENQWLARASRIRLKGELIRDQALSISQLLNDAIGGPSVKPYQPEGLWAETSSGGGSLAKYVQGTGVQLYRKSLYTFWKRTLPPPSMMTFDATTRDLCTVKRQKTNTPLQALVLLNDPQIVEAGRSMAYQAMNQFVKKRERITYLFRLATSRLPNEEELKVLSDYFESERKRFESTPEAVKEYLVIGEYRALEEVNQIDLAAYAMVANTILNLDEAITRG